MADEDEGLTPGQKAIIDGMRQRGGAVTAERYAYLAYGRDIEDLADEQLQTIPAFLLEPWLAQHGEQE
jgi:hypothetical protein